MAYASSLDILSRFMEERGLVIDNKIKVIISSAEKLEESTRSRLKSVFKNTDVISRYSNQENGILAQELLSNSSFFVLNHSSYKFEFLKINLDEKAREGELSRIVITDLYNKAVPMIRDIGIYEYSNKYGVISKSIEGRKRDFIYSTDGKLLSPSFITSNMWMANVVDQFQFIQTGPTDYTLKIKLQSRKDLDLDKNIKKF